MVVAVSIGNEALRQGAGGESAINMKQRPAFGYRVAERGDLTITVARRSGAFFAEVKRAAFHWLSAGKKEQGDGGR